MVMTPEVIEATPQGKKHLDWTREKGQLPKSGINARKKGRGCWGGLEPGVRLPDHWPTKRQRLQKSHNGGIPLRWRDWYSEKGETRRKDEKKKEGEESSIIIGQQEIDVA